MSMSKKRRLLGISKWLLLFMILTLLLANIRKEGAKEDSLPKESLVFSELIQEGVQRIKKNMIEGQSVLMDLLAGNEPVFF